MLDALIVLLKAWFFVSCMTFCVESSLLYWWARRQGAPVRYVFSGVPGETLRGYLRWCRQSGTPPDERRIRRHRLVQNNFIASLGGFGVILVIAAVRERL